MSLLISSVYTYDADASAYILAVEAADEIASPGIGALEPATRSAINKFVVGCKADGIWTAIKASCILSGARTLAGALVPLVGAAPTNVGPFVSGDYNRKTGLVGDGSTKYLNSNRAPTADPQNSNHQSAYATEIQTTGNLAHLGALTTGSLYSVILRGGSWAFANNTPNTQFGAPTANLPLISSGFFGTSRALSSEFNIRAASYTAIASLVSATPSSFNYAIFARNNAGTFDFRSSSRLAFYSIGESLDLARLDARVTDLINAFAVTIP
jgi:hypothetical protein